MQPLPLHHALISMMTPKNDLFGDSPIYSDAMRVCITTRLIWIPFNAELHRWRWCWWGPQNWQGGIYTAHAQPVNSQRLTHMMHTIRSGIITHISHSQQVPFGHWARDKKQVVPNRTQCTIPLSALYYTHTQKKNFLSAERKLTRYRVFACFVGRQKDAPEVALHFRYKPQPIHRGTSVHKSGITFQHRKPFSRTKWKGTLSVLDQNVCILLNGNKNYFCTHVKRLLIRDPFSLARSSSRGGARALSCPVLTDFNASSQRVHARIHGDIRLGKMAPFKFPPQDGKTLRSNIVQHTMQGTCRRRCEEESWFDTRNPHTDNNKYPWFTVLAGGGGVIFHNDDIHDSSRPLCFGRPA